MSAMLEQSADELDVLVGAKITGVRVVKDGDEYGFDSIEIDVHREIAVNVDGEFCHDLSFQVWEDPEGNGPGYLALVRAR
jgi:hypothetical protein